MSEEAAKTSHADAMPAAVATPAAVAMPAAVAAEVAADTKISFSNTDFLVNTEGEKSTVTAPKDETTLAEIAKERSLIEENKDDEEEEDERLFIGDNVDLDITDINDLNKSAAVALKPPVLDFEILL